MFMAGNRYIPEITLCIPAKMRHAAVSCEGVVQFLMCSVWLDLWVNFISGLLQTEQLTNRGQWKVIRDNF